MRGDTNGKVLSDQAERERIRTDHGHNLVCLAGAGAGKTHELVERMVGVIGAGGAPVGGVAAITFTRKAAGELRGRFFLRLQEAAREASGPASARLREAVDNIDQCFIGTIHAFCARLLRERPLEAGLSPGFSEIEEREELGLLRNGWDRFVQERAASGDERLAIFEELGQSLEQGVYPFFVRRCQFSDLALKPATVDRPDLDPGMEVITRLLREVEPHLPDAAENPDRFTQMAESTKHLIRYGGPLKEGDKAHLLTQFQSRSATGVTLNRWTDQGFARRLRDDLLEAVRGQIDPLLRQWRQYLYGLIGGFTDEAMRWHRSQRLLAGTLTFQDLLEQCAGLLRSNAAVREYFARRYEVLLVDEFQDTDPLQAEILLYLSAVNHDEPDWRLSKPRPGSLFVVGDEKQSIYRFRRADVEVFRLAHDCVTASGGQTTQLTTSFRAVPPLVSWLNAAFGPLFAQHERQFQAEFTVLEAAPRKSVGAGAVYKIPHEKIQRDRRAVIAQRDAERIADFIAGAMRGDSEPLLGACAAAGDFMIVTRTTAMMLLYARCLEARGVAYDIVGTGSLRQSAQLRALVEVLEAVYRRDDPVALIAYLRGGLVGLGDDELYEFRHGGGHWDFTAPLPDGLAPGLRQRLQVAFVRLRSASVWLLEMTPAAAIERLVDDSGLAAFAAAGEAGSSKAGNLLRTLALVRDFEARHGMDWGRITQQLRAMMEDPDYRIEEMCLESGRDDVVRIMNVHQAKGLEAKVVFLADPADTSPRQFGVEFHVSRAGDSAFLSMPVAIKRTNMRPQLIAEPPGWEEDEALERQFEEAEEIRLLYVAATRASDLLVVSTYEAGSQPGPWASLLPALEQAPVLPVAALVSRFATPDGEAVEAPEKTGDAVDLDRLRRQRAQCWERIRQPSYQLRAVSETDEGELSVRGEPSSGAGGRDYGILVHRLFELAAQGRLPEDEEAFARTHAASMQMRPRLVDEALAALRRLRSSPLWREVSTADAVYTEVPLAATVDGDSTVVRGVIDLVYKRSDDGWRIVDYKTDTLDTTCTTMEDIKRRYGAQVEAYGRYWESISGDRVTAVGLWLTEQGYVPV